MTKKRSNWDFSEHTHTVEIFKSEKGNEIRVDHFQKGDSNIGYIKFVNDDRGLSIFGDFGNWIFCRPFHPSADGYVSDDYWIEKLKMSSIQVFEQLDFDSIILDINELINSGLEDYGYEGDDLIEAKEWYQELLEVAEGEDKFEYTYKAYRDSPKPDFIDYGEIPYYKEIPMQLNIIFDAFDEICNRMKNE